MGEEGSLDFTVVGDAANTVSRLGSAAAGGELIMSEEVAERAGVDTSHLIHRVLEVKGKADPIPVWIDGARASAN